MWRELVLGKGKLLLPFAGEALLVLGVYTAYSLVRLFVEGTESDAVDNALEIISMEQRLGIFHEMQIQRSFAAVPGLLLAMEGVYRFLYLPCLIAGAGAGYLRDRSLYRKYRSAFFLSLAIGLMCFTLLPTAPPRMLPEYGFVDIIHGSTVAPEAGRNNFAAVPSFHFGLPLLMTVGFCHAFKLKSWQIALAATLPAAMLLAIISTANHFFLDAVAGAAVVLFAAWWCVWRPVAMASTSGAPAGGAALESPGANSLAP